MLCDLCGEFWVGKGSLSLRNDEHSLFKSRKESNIASTVREELKPDGEGVHNVRAPHKYMNGLMQKWLPSAQAQRKSRLFYPGLQNEWVIRLEKLVDEGCAARKSATRDP
ncbi:hypothetical protein CIHG_03110 [Coccidioides immitis H538.4]|uniref:Uncharacterized protein n=1 Tax=Coccidioides immitis H538.4 TaxID=396776 RepID=A0A0J8RL07_COCIT|nr:hypothetical protein CIHG_03110 [Coccidioides immitis H538.4]